MISILGSVNRCCDGVSRRDFLQIGGLGVAGLALPEPTPPMTTQLAEVFVPLELYDKASARPLKEEGL